MNNTDKNIKVDPIVKMVIKLVDSIISDHERAAFDLMRYHIEGDVSLTKLLEGMREHVAIVHAMEDLKIDITTTNISHD